MLQHKVKSGGLLFARQDQVQVRRVKMKMGHTIADCALQDVCKYGG